MSSGLTANYATEAGNATTAKSASRAAEAGHASEADHAIQASDSDRATNSTYAQLAKEAERLNIGGNGIFISADSHLIVFLTPGLKPEECVMLDMQNRTLMNVASITTPDGYPYTVETPGFLFF
jgi:hypothetical protein